MSKIKEFLNDTTEISNGDRVIIVASTLGLMAMAHVLNYKLFRSRLDNLDKDEKIHKLETKLEVEKTLCQDDTDENLTNE